MKKAKAKDAPLTKSQISQLGKTLAQAIHVGISQREIDSFGVKQGIEALSAIATEHEKYSNRLAELRKMHQMDFARNKKQFREVARRGSRAVKGIANLLGSYGAGTLESLYRFLKGLPSMTDCDSVFKRVVAEANRRWGSPNYIVANVLNGTKQGLVSRRTRAYRTAASAVDKAKAKYGKRNRLLSLDGVVSVSDGDHYVAFVSGGNNGHSDWKAYFESLMMILEECKDAWIIDMDNDCCDDVHYALVGFRVGGRR